MEESKRISWPRVVFHVDMDAFFAAVEQRDEPSLRGKPVIVGGLGARGVVSTASYEARRYGVHSAMPMFQARKRCPHGVYRSPRMDVYAEVSRGLRAVLDRYSPEIEPLSLDEAFLDMSGTESLFGPPPETARRLLSDIQQSLGLTASVGVAPQKFIAKVASDLHKPNGLTVVYPGEEQSFLAPLPVEKLWGVGPKAREKLHDAGLHLIGDITRCERDWLEKHFGKSFGAHIYYLSHGIDERRVESVRQRKSIGVERTLERDLRSLPEAEAKMISLCEELGRLLRGKKQKAHGLRIKIKYSDFTSVTRQMRLQPPLDITAELRNFAFDLLQNVKWEKPVRLLGVAAILATDDDRPTQTDLFAAAPTVKKESQLDRTLDQLDARFGKGMVRRAQSVLPEEMTPGRLGPNDEED